MFRGVATSTRRNSLGFETDSSLGIIKRNGRLNHLHRPVEVSDLPFKFWDHLGQGCWTVESLSS